MLVNFHSVILHKGMAEFFCHRMQSDREQLLMDWTEGPFPPTIDICLNCTECCGTLPWLQNKATKYRDNLISYRLLLIGSCLSNHIACLLWPPPYHRLRAIQEESRHKPLRYLYDFLLELHYALWYSQLSVVVEKALRAYPHHNCQLNVESKGNDASHLTQCRAAVYGRCY